MVMFGGLEDDDFQGGRVPGFGDIAEYFAFINSSNDGFKIGKSRDQQACGIGYLLCLTQKFMPTHSRHALVGNDHKQIMPAPRKYLDGGFGGLRRQSLEFIVQGVFECNQEPWI